jgi:Uma2 family endonuclease
MSTLLPVDATTAARSLVLDPPLTDAELEALCRDNDNVQIERTREGVILMNPPAGGFTSSGNLEISRQLGNWVATHERGRAFDSSGGFYLPDGSMLSPDAAYVVPESLKGMKDADFTGFPRLCPDFVIELLSPTDSLARTQLKLKRWIENGVQLGWLVDPYARKAYVYAPGAPLVTVVDSAVHGSGPVKGFVLDLARVWRCYEL